MAAEDGTDEAFERELVVRLGARADAVGGSPPLAGLRAEGRRRARRRAAVRGSAAVAVLAVGAGGLAQLGGGGGGSVVTPGVSASPSASPSPDPLDRYNQVPPASRSGGPTGATTSWHLPSATDFPGRGVSSCDPAKADDGADFVFDAEFLAVSSQRQTVSSPWWSPGQPYTTPSAPPPQNTNEAARAVDELAASQLEDRYLGACWDPYANTLYVRRVPGGAEFDQAVRAAARPWPAVTLVFQDVGHSFAELKSVARKASADTAYWKSRNVQSWHWRILPDGSGVDVVLPGNLWDRTQEVAAEFKQRYGPLLLDAVKR